MIRDAAVRTGRSSAGSFPALLRPVRTVLPGALALAVLAAGPVVTAPLSAQGYAGADPADVATLDGIIRAYYDVVSGPAGGVPDRERDRTLHLPGAVVGIPVQEGDGSSRVVTMSLDAYHDRFGAPREEGFWEREIHRIVHRYGNVAHVLSTYASSTTPQGEAFARGVNSIQLTWDGTRWWIVSWIFDQERPGNPIPPELLPEGDSSAEPGRHGAGSWRPGGRGAILARPAGRPSSASDGGGSVRGLPGRHESPRREAMSSIKDTAARFFDACERGHGWDACREYCHPEASFTAQADTFAGIETLEAYTEAMKGLIAGPIPDASYELRSLAVDEARGSVSGYAVFRGTHSGEGGPVAPSGKRTETDYVYVMEFDGDRIRHMTKIWNDGFAMRQLGWA